MIKCHNSYFYCPPCWKNFIDNIIRNGYKSYKHKTGDDVPIEVINSALGKYKAMYIEKAATVPCIIFEDDKFETMFILEWS